jgi:uncharacterized protein YuzE
MPLLEHGWYVCKGEYNAYESTQSSAIITAFLSSKKDQLERQRKVWQKSKQRRSQLLYPHLLDIPYKKMSADYDEEADVIYFNFKENNHAGESELINDDVIVRYENEDVIGMTFLNASKRCILSGNFCGLPVLHSGH